MFPYKLNYILLFCLLTFTVTVAAKTVFINDRVMIGIHQEKSVDTPIVKLVPGGTSLDLIKQDEPLSQIRDPDGIIGWVDNTYLTETEPGRAQLAAAESKMEKLAEELEQLKSVTGPAATEQDGDPGNSLLKENEELKQLLKSERLRVGELQAQTAELKNRLSGMPQPSVDTGMLDELSSENKLLRQELEKSRTTINTREPVEISLGDLDWKKLLIVIAVSLLTGIVTGIYLLDLKLRKRHGGFRI